MIICCKGAMKLADFLGAVALAAVFYSGEEADGYIPLHTRITMLWILAGFAVAAAVIFAFLRFDIQQLVDSNHFYIFFSEYL